ncbi:hypothetical protein [Streptomyces sp. AM 2-1-1]|uniref:hypothetical protein n=1 Tax=Streptomyces sp. AM 2-1-1 TaxID=3028709 RepID=UPI0023B9B76A|nr:hypothetical protein [Streptomyces sp. AM 2-1-1]WEH41494.1 hypothetical protein PZB77_19425 [Streptomyces sp. AM 2-1-1]
MSAISFALLLTTAAATAVGAAAVHTARGLHRQVAELRSELAQDRSRARTVPAQSRTGGTTADEIREAVSQALAEERERELAEARAFWAAQEARDAADAPSLLGGLSGLGDDTPYFLPRQADFAGLEVLSFRPGDESDEDEAAYAVHPAQPAHPDDAAVTDAMQEFAELAGLDDLAGPAEPRETAGTAEESAAGDSPELAAARRRHPSHPDFVPVRTPVITDHERTVNRLKELADTGTELTDVRPGPLGTLDVYVFADGTTLCMTPGHRETAERLAASLRAGEQPVLLGGSGVSGAYALTFSCGADNVYILADRVIASF